jgi:hypothetical protein
MPEPYFRCELLGTRPLVLPPGDVFSMVLPGADGPSALGDDELERVLGLPAAATSGVDAGVHRQLLQMGVSLPAAAHVFAFSHALQRAFLTPHHMATLRPRYALEPTSPQGG